MVDRDAPVPPQDIRAIRMADVLLRAYREWKEKQEEKPNQ